MRDWTPEQIQEMNRLVLVLDQHIRACPECAECCEDETCPVGDKIREQIQAVYD
jgi:recombinational DNA repair protein RecR